MLVVTELVNEDMEKEPKFYLSFKTFLVCFFLEIFDTSGIVVTMRGFRNFFSLLIINYQ